MNLPIWPLLFPPLCGPKNPYADISGTVLGADAATSLKPDDDVFGITMNPFTGGTLCEVAHLSIASTTVIKKPEEWSHVQAGSLPLVWLTARTCIACVEPHVKDMPGKRLVVLGGSSATGMSTIFMAKAPWKALSSCSGQNADFVTNTMGADEVLHGRECTWAGEGVEAGCDCGLCRWDGVFGDCQVACHHCGR